MTLSPRISQKFSAQFWLEEMGRGKVKGEVKSSRHPIICRRVVHLFECCVLWADNLVSFHYLAQSVDAQTGEILGWGQLTHHRDQ